MIIFFTASYLSPDQTVALAFLDAAEKVEKRFVPQPDDPNRQPLNDVVYDRLCPRLDSGLLLRGTLVEPVQLWH